MLARLALGAELPPRPGGAAVRVGHGGDERVEQAGIEPPGLDGAQALEQLLAVLAREVLGALDAEPDQLARHRRPDVGDGREIAHPRDDRAPAGRRLVENGRALTAGRWGGRPRA